ncbi:hypothetical protein [Herbaspirillum huttiense]|uniref:hypothetical protein n=1 Tax=Herbaspirillum huttiense TaxID=863372 RepID=UPI0031D8DAB8
MRVREKPTAGLDLGNVWGALEAAVQGVRLSSRSMPLEIRATSDVMAEERLELLREGVRVMVQQFSTGSEYADVVAAYDAGLSSGFYRKRSAIAQGYRHATALRFADMRQQHRRAYALSLRKIYAVGFEQGRLLAAGLWD